MSLFNKNTTEYKATDVFGHNDVGERITRTSEGKYILDATHSTVKKSAVISKLALMISCGLVAIMGVSFAVATIYSATDEFTVKVGNMSYIGKDGEPIAGALSLSETKGFSNPSSRLSGLPIENMDNITYDWLDLDAIKSTVGSGNGENYFCYSFYLTNNTNEKIDYTVHMDILKATRNVDGAIRVMTFFNDDNQKIYAKATENGTSEVYPEGCIDFYDEQTVFNETREGLESGGIDKYTVVVWLEGEDPDCVNSILKGVMQMQLMFETDSAAFA